MKNTNSKKVIVSLIAGTIMATTVSASAAWEFAGYDTTTPPVYGKIYNEVINGKYTSKSKTEMVSDKDVEWKAEGFELAYPHAGYERLYLEGNAQSITRYNGQLPQWETRFHDFMWEVAGEHRIYQRQQTKIPGMGWQWDYGNDSFGIDDSAVFVPTTRVAVTTDSFKPYGIAAWDMKGKLITEDMAVFYEVSDFNKDLVSTGYVSDGYKYGPFTVKLDEEGLPTKEIVDGSFFSDENLSQLDYDGQYVVTDEVIAQKVGLIASKYVTGPSFYGENGTKNVAEMFTNLYNEGHNPFAWFWDADSAVHQLADISWTAPEYQMEEPYDYYQYLVVNGVVFDGREDLPRVFRYTGGKASPKVEWKYQWSEAAYPYNVIEFKYIDGKLAVEEDGTPVYRIPTGEFGNIYFKSTATEIQLWVKDGRGGDDMITSWSRVDSDFGGGVGGYVQGSNFIYNY